MVPFSRLGGKSGLAMTRSAFAVMVKFSDLHEDFTALVDEVAMQASLEEEGPTRDKAIMDQIKESAHGDMIIRRWESASRMR
mmetsp:Transcript_41592/g.63467  ORF Transcript_41592/g.63467 Transcript_41592/m.63467 type:complete len:82 (+) Transcript_41592:2658-2903(+)